MTPDDPVTPPLQGAAGKLPPDERRCTARSKQTGDRCGAWRAPGQRVCRWHGAASPQAKKAAALRMADLIDPAIVVLGKAIADENTPWSPRLRAVENVLDRGGVPRRAELDLDAGRAGLLERLRALDDTPDVA